MARIFFATAYWLDEAVKTKCNLLPSVATRYSNGLLRLILYYRLMHQIKIFKGIENDIAGLEKQINGWLEQSNAQVISITGNIAPQSPPPDETLKALGQSPWAPSDLLVIVHYSR